ncbi:HAD-IIIC family phosphatase [Acetobacter fabarum]|uniref:Capsular biosynthesis protein n=1 Tax=Acetobacter fabarum TaxID=483199 RepID=A0A269XQ90_9PROT|nr:HAD-IIIC family phosphatase [Acetobacter fabarum]PAK75400.1 capsular biosynthesis protein [Acetobacter fabarum]PEN27945.1 capsular biosynthesis protein [Acetobacter fabarum]
MKNLVIDLDYTICTPYENEDQSSDPVVKYSNATPIMDVIEKIRQYKKDGFNITIHTSRNMRTYNGDVSAIVKHTLPVITDWLDRHDVPYDSIVVGKPWCGHDGFYIDDKAIRPSEFRQLSYDQIISLLEREQA